MAQLVPGCARGFGECQAIGFADDEGKLQAGVVYHNWSPENGTIEISAASVNRHWLTKERLSVIFDYPFAIGCRLVVARTGESNHRVRRIWRSLGSDEYIIPALRSPTEAEIILTLSAAQWLRYRRKMLDGETKSSNAT